MTVCNKFIEKYKAMRKDFALCFNDHYAPYACVTIRSIAEAVHRDDEVYIHLLIDNDLTKRSEKNIQKSAVSTSGKKINVKFYKIEGDADLSLIPESLTKKWSIAAWFRILLPKLLDDNIQRVLYLDCDVIVNDHLDDLFAMDISNKSLGGCVDVILNYDDSVYERLQYNKSKGYICSGVLLLNIDYWRQNNLEKRLLDYAVNNASKFKFFDQDTINYVCQDSKIILPSKYGVMTQYFTNRTFLEEHVCEIQEMIKSPAIIHYAGSQPWIFSRNKSLHSYLWWKHYRGLRQWPEIQVRYIIFFFRHILKTMFIRLKLIKPDAEYCRINYPKIKEKDVLRLLSKIFSGKSKLKRI